MGLITIEEPKAPPKTFTFDGAYGIDSTTETIYNDVGFALVESVRYIFFPNWFSINFWDKISLTKGMRGL